MKQIIVNTTFTTVVSSTLNINDVIDCFKNQNSIELTEDEVITRIKNNDPEMLQFISDCYEELTIDSIEDYDDVGQVTSIDTLD